VCLGKGGPAAVDIFEYSCLKFLIKLLIKFLFKICFIRTKAFSEVSNFRVSLVN
jgi:hypothetical protein